jgi:hypothetical protein
LRQRRLALMCISAVIAACMQGDHGLSRDQLALEALVRVVAPMSIKTSGRTVTTICLSRSSARTGEDPDSIVLERLRDVSPPVRAASTCAHDRTTPDTVPFSPTHSPPDPDAPTAIAVIVSEPTWSTDTSASVVAGYSVDGLNAAEYTCIIRRRKKAVVVSGCTLISIAEGLTAGNSWRLSNGR